MWPDLIVGALEGVEDALLHAEIRGRRSDRARLERAVEPFMRAVLLRTPGCDALVCDAELQPPHVKAVEPVNPRRGKGRTVASRSSKSGSARS